MDPTRSGYKPDSYLKPCTLSMQNQGTPPGWMVGEARIGTVLEVLKERGLGHTVGVLAEVHARQTWKGLRHSRVHKIINV